MFSGNNLPQAVALGIRGVAQWQRRPRRAMMGAQLLSDLFDTDFIAVDLTQYAAAASVSYASACCFSIQGLIPNTLLAERPYSHWSVQLTVRRLSL